MIIQQNGKQKIILKQSKQNNTQNIFSSNYFNPEKLFEYADSPKILPVQLNMTYSKLIASVALLKKFNIRYSIFPLKIILQNYRGDTLKVFENLQSLYLINCYISNVIFSSNPLTFSAFGCTISNLSHFPTYEFHLHETLFLQTLNLPQTLTGLSLVDVSLKNNHIIDLNQYQRITNLSLKQNTKLQYSAASIIHDLVNLKLENFSNQIFNPIQFYNIQTLILINCELDIELMLSYGVNKIQHLELNKYNFKQIDLKLFKNLKQLKLDFVETLITYKNVRFLDLQFQDINLILPFHIHYFIGNSSKNITVHNQLRTIQLRNCELHVAQFQDYKYLVELDISCNYQITSVELPQQIKILYIKECNLLQLNLEHLQMDILDISSNSNLYQVQLPKILRVLYANQFSGEYLNLMQAKGMQYLFVNKSNIKYIFYDQFLYLSFEQCLHLKFIQIKNNTEYMIQNSINPSPNLKKLTLEQKYIQSLERKIKIIETQLHKIILQ